jgi:hypothetical protein
MRDSFGSAGKRFRFHGPAEGLGHGSVEVGDELLDLGTQVFLADEISAAEELSHQDREPEFDLVEPRGVSGREVEGDAMLRLGQERGTRSSGSKHAGFALHAEASFETAVACHEADDGLGEVDVEIVADDIPLRVGRGAAQHAAEKSREILFGSSIADDALDLAGGNVEGGDQGLSAVPPVFELKSFDLARHHRKIGRAPLQRLNAGLLIDRDGTMGIIGAGREFVDPANVPAFGFESGVGLGGQPVADAMRLEVGLFFKNRPTERCEMLGTSPRRIASSAISRWLQWLIGRSLSDGFSHVIATSAQICSGVYVGGAPDRGASASRSGTDCLSPAARHRLRQYLTVFGQTPTSRALARTPISSAACRMMRARNANCCGVEWVRTSCSSAARCSDKTVTGSAASRGMATSCSSSRFVLPQHRRFDSSNLSTLSGVKTSARLN